jgi:4-hydroxy 2-oxovalerate aldolase
MLEAARLEAARLSVLRHPLVVPKATVDALVGDGLGTTETFDFGLQVQGGTFRVTPTGCTIPSRLAIAYAMAVAVAGGARRILLAGVDGYPAGDPRQEEMVEVLRAYEQLPGAVPLLAVTPSTYPVPQSSVYAPTV